MWPTNLKIFILLHFTEKVCQLMIRERNIRLIPSVSESLLRAHYISGTMLGVLMESIA